jgi:hypothetical protein
MSKIVTAVHTIITNLQILQSNSMELSPSRQAAGCAATQELPSILWNPKLNYRVLKSQPLVPMLNQVNSVHTPFHDQS